MTDYRDNRVPGGTFFFTVRLLDRGSSLLTDHISAFGDAIRQARVRKPFHVDAWVVLPDHAHAMWTLPPGDHDCSSRWRAVKIAFSKALRKSLVTNSPDGAIWERQYQQFRVQDETQYAALIDYMHTNPMRHGLCEKVADWPWSSLHRFMSSGFAEPDPAVLPPWTRSFVHPGAGPLQFGAPV
ncbi:transposase [Massilia sp. IC2-278]|uniref:REP-associated tyrosine transposase n=1 Tax=Massilia sp. IC2-278 TaxID=2887200 RepID=UPI001E633F77|nr:transposase [Massilia sp. IC2-278]MCC2960017.1 transposase [Massilia sp. IC2-278]